MSTNLKKISADNLSWKPSPTGAPGCYGKKIFNYSAEGLGRDGAAGSYTTIYRFDPGASYPPFYVTEGVCELGVLEGTLEINDRAFAANEWTRLPSGEATWTLSSTEGCKVVGIVRGRLTLAQDSAAKPGIGSELERISVDDMDWNPSKTDAQGCAGKMLFRYGQDGLEREGSDDSYSTLYRFAPGAYYPPYVMQEGVCEISVLQGMLRINDEEFERGDWVQLPSDERDWRLGSERGAMVIGIVRGRIALVDSTYEQQEN